MACCLYVMWKMCGRSLPENSVRLSNEVCLHRPWRSLRSLYIWSNLHEWQSPQTFKRSDMFCFHVCDPQLNEQWQRIISCRSPCCLLYLHGLIFSSLHTTCLLWQEECQRFRTLKNSIEQTVKLQELQWCTSHLVWLKAYCCWLPESRTAEHNVSNHQIDIDVFYVRTDFCPFSDLNIKFYLLPGEVSEAG